MNEDSVTEGSLQFPLGGMKMLQSLKCGDGECARLGIHKMKQNKTKTTKNKNPELNTLKKMKVCCLNYISATLFKMTFATLKIVFILLFGSQHS